MKKSEKKGMALVIDANSLIHRAWHALPPLTAPDGTLVNAAYGFASILLKITTLLRPAYLIACWDTPEPTYRHAANRAYKAHRKKQPDEFYAQMPLAKRIMEALGGANIELPGYEADDLLATLASGFSKKGIETILLTSDRDAWQLISPRVKVMAFKKGVSETVLLDEKTLKELTGLVPKQVPVYKALSGDPSDNLPGVAGVGEKTATQLVSAYKNLNGIFKAAHNLKSALSPPLRKKLVDGEADARATLLLVFLDRKAPIEQKIEELKRAEVAEDEVRKLFTGLGFKSLLARLFGEVKTPARKKAEEPMAETVAKRNKSRWESGEIKVFLERCRGEGLLYLRPVESHQPTLFGHSPGLALAIKNESVLISSEQLGEKANATALGQALSDPKIKKVGHGLKAAWRWARNRGLYLKGLHFDTELAAYLLSAGDGVFDLDSQSAMRLKKFFSQGEERVLEEVEAVRDLHDILSRELKQEGLDRVLERFEIPLVPILGRMEADGIQINKPYFKQLASDFRQEKERLEKEMEGMAGETFNPGSTQQLSRILFEILNISSKGLKRGKTGISTASSELEKLEGKHPIIAKVSQYREVAKLLSTYVEALPALADAESRVHTTYNQALTATGRLSSSNPNLQNIPVRTELGRKIRKGFVAPKGRVLLACDYSQVELRVVAALAKDEKMADAFRRGLDIHTATAASIWDIPLDEVSKEQRRAAKAVNFGIIYGQGPMALSKSAGISFEEAKRFIEEYFLVYSKIREYLDATMALAHVRGYVETLFGRRRPISDINSPIFQLRAAAERMAINMPVQGTAADLIKLAMIKVAEALPEISKDSRLLLQVHDELVFEIPEKDVAQAAERIRDIMQNVEDIGVPLVVDVKSGPNWEEMMVF